MSALPPGISPIDLSLEVTVTQEGVQLGKATGHVPSHVIKSRMMRISPWTRKPWSNWPRSRWCSGPLKEDLVPHAKRLDRSGRAIKEGDKVEG